MWIVIGTYKVYGPFESRIEARRWLNDRCSSWNGLDYARICRVRPPFLETDLPDRAGKPSEFDTRSGHPNHPNVDWWEET